MSDYRPFLSKSKYLLGLQCPMLLWANYNDKESLPDVDDATQAMFDQGHEVGNLAKTLFPGGVEIERESGIDSILARSREALVLRKPLFEAGFRHGDTYAQVDVLVPVRGGMFDLVEVKGSASVKPVHIEDVAFQRYVYEGAGVPIRKCFLMHIDKNYERFGAVEPEKLFAKVDITKETAALLLEIPGRVEAMMSVILSPSRPETETGEHCSDPYDCPLCGDCWPELPEGHVSQLYRGGYRSDDLVESGVHLIKDIPDDYSLTERQQIQVAVAKDGYPHIDRDAIREFLRYLEYPLFFLDFETIYTVAIPPYDFLSPYEQMPFQYSLHILRKPDGVPEHHEFLADGKTDPRPEIMKRLKGLLESRGSIVAYNCTFERNVLRGCADHFRGYSIWLKKLESRFVDLLEPFRQFAWHHPRQGKSCSLKTVLPLLTGKGYDGLEIGEGGEASSAFMSMAFSDMPEDEKKTTRKALLEYCALDTQGMVDISRKLDDLVRI